MQSWSISENLRCQNIAPSNFVWLQTVCYGWGQHQSEQNKGVRCWPHQRRQAPCSHKTMPENHVCLKIAPPFFKGFLNPKPINHFMWLHAVCHWWGQLQPEQDKGRLCACDQQSEAKGQQGAVSVSSYHSDFSLWRLLWFPSKLSLRRIVLTLRCRCSDWVPIALFLHWECP